MRSKAAPSQPQPPEDAPFLLDAAVPIKNCPIATSLGVLGRKWTILILRDISMMKLERFNQLLKATPGLTPRVLSNRLRELEEEGMIERVEERKGPRFVRWGLTEKGRDTIPILMRFAAFGSKWYADVVFEDKKPKKLREIYPAWEAQSVESRYP
jgi:DNA-binding HxlR family transcriptional regulator